MAWSDDPTTLYATAPQVLASYTTGVWAETNVCTIIGDGVRDIQFLCYGPPAGRLDLWFDSFKHDYDGQPEWYALHFPTPTTLNTVYWLHGAVFNEGGWWTSLAVQYQNDAGEWRDVTNLVFSPDYDFSNQRANRQPFAAYVARFEQVTTTAIRLIGMPSGTHSMNSMDYLAADQATSAAIAEHLAHIQRPLPRIFRILPARRLWQIFTTIRTLTAVAFDVQTIEGLGLDHFLASEDHQQFHQTQTSILDPHSLYSLLGNYEGWDKFGKQMIDARALAQQSQKPTIVEHHGGMIWLCIPLALHGEVIATIENRNLIAVNQLDHAWHDRTMRAMKVKVRDYSRALAQVPILSNDQLNGVIDFILNVTSFSEEIIANIAETANLRSIKLASKLMDQTKRSLIDLMGHELRTPLNAIIGYSEMLLEDEPNLSPQAYNDIQHIQHSGKHLLHLVTMILDIANIESGTMEVHLEDFEPVEVLHAISVSLRSSIRKRNNSYIFQTASDVGTITADKIKFRQIMFHLINNANKFTHDGQIHVNLRLNPHNCKQLQICVRDTGIGIAPEHIPQLFTEFGQLDPSSTRRYDGAGMGLALSRHLARLMNGDITVTSELNIGSCFSLILPYHN